MADHGVSFEPGGSRRHPTDVNLHEIAFMPLFVKLPGQHEGRIVDGFVRTIDILPTIADALGRSDPRAKSTAARCLGRRPAADGNGRGCRMHSSGLSPRRRSPSFSVAAPSALRRQTDVFGDGGWSGIYRFGPHSELVGRPLAGLDVGNADGLTVELDVRLVLEDYDPNSPLSPAYVTGTDPARRRIGPRRGRQRTDRGNDGRRSRPPATSRFAVFVPEAALKLAETTSTSLPYARTARSRAWSASAPAFRLEDGTVRRANGTALRLDTGAVRGALEVSRHKDRFVFSGWAVDLDRRRPVEFIAIFVDGRLVHAVQWLTYGKPEPGTTHEGVEEAAFRIGLPMNVLPVPGNGHEVPRVRRKRRYCRRAPLHT